MSTIEQVWITSPYPDYQGQTIGDWLSSHGFALTQENVNKVAQYSLNPPTPQPTPTPTNVKSGFGVYYLLPIPFFIWLHKTRDRFISKKLHKRIHPLV